MDFEKLFSRERRNPSGPEGLSQAEIDQFSGLCLSEGDFKPTVVSEVILMLREHKRPSLNSLYYRKFGGGKSGNKFFQSLYPAAEGRDLDYITDFDHDAIDDLMGLAGDTGLDPSHENAGGNYNKWIRQKIFGGYYDPHDHAADDSPAIKARYENGMPRQGRMLGALTTIFALAHTNHNNKEYDEIFYNLPDFFGLSDEESRAVLDIYVKRNGEEKVDTFPLRAAILDPRVRQQYSDKNGDFDLDLFGGKTALGLVARSAFDSYIKGNEGLWRMANETFPAQINRLLPMRERCDIIADKYSEWPAMPHDRLLEYLPAEDFAKIAHEKLLDQLDVPDKEPGNVSRLLSQVAVSLEMESGVIEAARYEELKYLFDIVEELASEESDIVQQAVEHRVNYENRDQKLFGMLDQYRRLINDESLKWYSDGHYPTGDPKDDEWRDRRWASANKIRIELKALREKIKGHTNTTAAA